MAISNLLRNIIEVGFGVLYVMGAIFNSLYTLRHGDEFYGSFADKALLVSSTQLIREVIIPHARLFAILFIIFQVVVAVCILSRGTLVRPGLIAGAIFSLVVVFVSNTYGAIANLIMCIVQIYLALIR
jgi:uncharacterized membrane protein YphA (DoxX/SURF4 family)